MNKLFLRLVLFVMHRTEKQHTRFGLNYFLVAEPVIRYNGLMCSGLLSMMFLVTMFADSDGVSFPGIICCGGIAVYFLFLTINAWFFHLMRRKKMFQKARLRKVRQRTRWMLNATPWCFIGLILTSLMFVSTWSYDNTRDLMFMRIVLALVFPLFFAGCWIVVATTPFHTGYGGCKPRASSRPSW